MIRSSVIRQLLALRSAAMVVVEQADAVLAACDEDEAKPAPVPAEPAGCKHTGDLREDTTTGGGAPQSYFCRGCKRTSDEIAADENGDD